MKKTFSVNLAGKVKNYSLSKNKALMPLFEAIVNSINAIDERRERETNDFKGQITIFIHRSAEDRIKEIDNTPNDVTGFEIVDNGCGFNDRNMTSFLESDSTYKSAIGGKGVGRFSWLKAFKKAEIRSVFKSDDGSFIEREFTFNISGKEMEVIEKKPQKKIYETSVTLDAYLRGWKEHVPKQLETITNKIMQHCFGYFFSETCPRIFLVDDGQKISLNDEFTRKFKYENDPHDFFIKNTKFRLSNFRINDENFNGNQLYLCANSRVVSCIDLSKYIVNLNKKFYADNHFLYVGVLNSAYLDDNVDTNRLSFDIPNDEATLQNEITWNEIISQTVHEIQGYLKSELAFTQQQKVHRIEGYVERVAPQYRHLLKYMKKEIDEIRPGIDDDKLYNELDKIDRKFDRQMKVEQGEILKTIEGMDALPEEYEPMFRIGVEKITEANSSTLAKYVMHRNIIIKLFELGLKKKLDGNFQKEKYIHNLIYPMKKTADDIENDAHNLWLIDERLSYCNYIASDVPFDEEKERPDILFMNKPFAIADSMETQGFYNSVVIIELKRPMRNDYKTDENPMAQLYNYVRKIRDGKACDKYGRRIRVTESTQYYLYAICDDTESLEKYLCDYDYIKTPDTMGYYQFNRRLNAYCEVLTFDKILVDAKKRNRILFHKLGLGDV